MFLTPELFLSSEKLAYAALWKKLLNLDLRQAFTPFKMSFKSTSINFVKDCVLLQNCTASIFTLCSCILLKASAHFAEHHNRNLISIRGRKIILEYIVNLLLLGSFHLTYTSYQSLAAPLPAYCISLPCASTLSVICLHAQGATNSIISSPLSDHSVHKV